MYLSLCPPAGHRGQNTAACEVFGVLSFSKGPRGHGSERRLGKILASFWNQKTSELEKALEMPWLKHLLSEMRETGRMIWEGGEAVGGRKRVGSSRVVPSVR